MRERAKKKADCNMPAGLGLTPISTIQSDCQALCGKACSCSTIPASPTISSISINPWSLLSPTPLPLPSPQAF